MGARVVSTAIRSAPQASHHHRHTYGAVSAGTKHALLTLVGGDEEDRGRREEAW